MRRKKYKEAPELVLYGIKDKNKQVEIPEIKVQYISTGEYSNKIASSDDVAAFLKSIVPPNTIELQEQFFVLYLNRANKIKGYYKHAIGGITGVVADIRIILAVALKTLSSSIIVAHNHPSGNLKPSEADKDLTRRLKDSAKTMDISLLDHLIITTGGYYSFADEGLMGIEKEEKKEKVKAEAMAKKVERISESVKYIRRFIALHNKVKTPAAILTLIKSLQRAIVEKQITKASSHVAEVKAIQDKLIKTYNSMTGQKLIKLDDKLLIKYVAIAGGEQVFPSIRFIKRFITMQGKPLNEQKKEAFTLQMEKAVKDKKIVMNDPFIDKLQRIYSYLKKSKGVKKVSIDQSELNGLKCICKACDKELGKIYDTKGKRVRRCKSGKYSDAKKGACSYNKGIEPLGKLYDTKGKRVRRCRSGKYSDAGKGACSYNKGLAGVMTAEQIANMTFQLLPFSGIWSNLVGKPEKNFTMMVHGEPGAGKSTFLIKFAKYLTNFGNVLYVASEEFGSVTLQNLVTSYLNPIPKNLVFVPNLDSTDPRRFDFVIFDSINDAGLKLDDYKQLRAESPNTAFILVLQHTKDGQFKGGKEWEHEMQIAGKIQNGTISIYKNRYGNKGELNFFEI